MDCILYQHVSRRLNFLIHSHSTCSFVDRDMFIRFTGAGVGHGPWQVDSPSDDESREEDELADDNESEEEENEENEESEENENEQDENEESEESEEESEDMSEESEEESEDNCMEDTSLSDYDIDDDGNF